MKGKILVCLQDVYETTAYMSPQAASTGAIGIILAKDKDLRNDTETWPHVLPASYVNFTDGNYIFTYINRTK